MDETTKLLLLAGEIFDIKLEDGEILKIKSPTLRDIIKFGYTKYNIALSNLLTEPSDLFKDSDVDFSSITTLDILIYNYFCIEGSNKDDMTDWLKFLINDKISFLKFNDVGFMVYETDVPHVVTSENYEDIKLILKQQFCLISNKKEMKMANKKAKEIFDKINKGKAKLNGNSEITFSDLISSVAANANGLNIINIWDLTYYQFNDQFHRMRMIEDYDIGIRSLLAGSKKEDVNLKYYIFPIEND